ncbi:MAG TPA: AI-2E family transporter [Candidatus Binataceae bacterium]|nr:AI-2E family transporter [Candidatus Binataceae bacterium]
MDDLSNGSGLDPADSDESQSHNGWRHALALLTAATVLYVARTVLIPVAVASLLTVVLSPLASRLERVVGRALSAAVLVLLSLAIVSGAAYFFTDELSGVIHEVAGYSDNITRKVQALKHIAPSSLGQIERLVATVRSQVEGPNPHHRIQVVQMMPEPKSISAQLSPTLPVLGGLFQSFMVIVLMFFLLYDRASLRDRLVRLAARARIPVAAKALDEAGERISRYLLFYALINFCFGLSVGLLCWVTGLQRPLLWGTLAFFLRFIPYIGAITAALLPTLVAIAVFPGWWKALAIVGIYTGIDQFTAQFIEPVVIGHGVGVSPVAMLGSAIFWAWLWGPVGLVLSTPFCVCLKVAGDYIPSLGFFSILLGEDEQLEGYHDYYRRLLEMDLDGARALVQHFCDLHGLQETFAKMLAPALDLAQRERARDNITASSYRLIEDISRELVIQLGERFPKPQSAPRLRILGVWPLEQTTPVMLTMVLQLLRLDGFAAGLPPGDAVKSSDDLVRFVSLHRPDLICIAWSNEEQLGAVEELVHTLMAGPGSAIVGMGPSDPEQRQELRRAGCLRVCDDAVETRRAIWRLAARRERGRKDGLGGAFSAAGGWRPK